MQNETSTQKKPFNKQARRSDNRRNELGNRPFEDALGSLRSKPYNDTKQYNENSFGKSFEETYHERNRQERSAPSVDLPVVNSWKKDGIDHINVHHCAETELGWLLSTYGICPFKHREFGLFKTVRGMLAWMRDPRQSDRFRYLTGTEAERLDKNYGNSAAVKNRIANYVFTTMNATWQKIQANAELREKLAQSDLPFDFYYNQITARNPDGSPAGRVRIRVSTSYAFISGFEELRNAVKENRKPNLSFLLHPNDRNEYLKQLEDEASQLNVNFTGEDKPQIENINKKKKSFKKKFNKQNFAQPFEEGVTTNDAPISVDAGNEALAASTPIEAQALNFGNMQWKPELTKVMPITSNGQVIVTPTQSAEDNSADNAVAAVSEESVQTEAATSSETDNVSQEAQAQ